MDKTAHYQNIIQNYLEREVNAPNADVPRLLVLDQLAQRYLVLAKGWKDEKYVHHCLYHLEIIDGKIWIHEDRTEEGIAHALADLGIPKTNIILAYFPEYGRAMSGFGIS